MGYTIQATDDTIGHVEDLLIDDEDWSIALLMIDTRNWWPGRKVVVSPDRIREIRWGDSTAVVDLSRDEVERSPEFDPAATSRRAERASVYRPY